MSIELTKSADRLVCLMYKTYLSRVKDGQSKLKARQFGSLQTFAPLLVPDEATEDVRMSCIELRNAGLLHTVVASGRIIRIDLTDKGIYYLENRFKDGVIGVASFLAQFI